MMIICTKPFRLTGLSARYVNYLEKFYITDINIIVMYIQESELNNIYFCSIRTFNKNFITLETYLNKKFEKLGIS